jgi:hypothetical protein
MTSVEDDDIYVWMGITLSGFKAAVAEEVMKCGSKKREPLTKEDRHGTKILKLAFHQEISDGYATLGYKTANQ